MSENSTEKKPKPMRQYVSIECADCDAKAQLALDVFLTNVQHSLMQNDVVLVAEVAKYGIPDGWSQYGGETRRGYTIAAEFRCLNHARAYADKNHHARYFGRDEAILYEIWQCADRGVLNACQIIIRGVGEAGKHASGLPLEEERQMLQRWYKEERPRRSAYEQHILDTRLICALEKRQPKHSELMSLLKIATDTKLDAVGEVFRIKRVPVHFDRSGKILEADVAYRDRLVKRWDEIVRNGGATDEDLELVLVALMGAPPESLAPDLQEAVQAAEAPKGTETQAEPEEAPEEAPRRKLKPTQAAVDKRIEELQADLTAAREALLREGMERDRFRKALNFIAAALFEPPEGTPNIGPVDERILVQIEELYAERTARKTAEHEASEMHLVIEDLFYTLNHKLTRRERSPNRMLAMIKEQLPDYRDMVHQRLVDAALVKHAAELLDDDRGETKTAHALRSFAKRLDPSDS